MRQTEEEREKHLESKYKLTSDLRGRHFTFQAARWLQEELHEILGG